MSPSVKKWKREESRNAEDWISALPDSLLHHILSFLEMREVISTSLLSRRWRHLWAATPTLDFGRLNVWDPNTVNIALVLYESAKIQSFRIYSNIRDDASSHGDSWIRFAVRHQVQELDLDLGGDDDIDDRENLYRLHHCLFTCGSIKILRLKFCILNLPTSVHLHLLKTLELWYLELTDMEIKVLTSSCPLLENMALVDCNTRKDLNVFAPNQNLRSLRIRHDWADHSCGVEIFAPHVLSVELGGTLRRSYKFQNLSSLVSAQIDFEEALCNEYLGDVYLLVGLLSDLSRAKSLKVCGWCVQVLSVREVEDIGSLRFHATCLEIKTGLNKWDLPGLAYLLTNSHHLESLTINISETIGIFRDSDSLSRELSKYAVDKSKYWKLLELSLSCQLSHLKTVQVYGFMRSKRLTEEECQGVELDKFIQRREIEVELVEFFLENSKMLDKIIISIDTEPSFHEFIVKSELVLNLTNRLQLLPMASQNAKIVFS